MQRLLLFQADDREFTLSAIEGILRSHNGFHDIRFSEPGGAVVEAEYSIGHDSTLVRLNSDRKTISISGASNGALEVVLLIRQALHVPLRLIDADYSFDLPLRD